MQLNIDKAKSTKFHLTEKVKNLDFLLLIPVIFAGTMGTISVVVMTVFVVFAVVVDSVAVRITSRC